MEAKSHYSQALLEFESGDVDKELVAHAYVNADGNESRVKVEYMKLRVAQLSAETRLETTVGILRNFLPDDSSAGLHGRPSIVLGVESRKLTAKERAQAISNFGVVATGVYRNSPAEFCGIAEGDIIRSINGHPVLDPSVQGKLLGKFSGQLVTVEIVREGSLQFLDVQLAGRPSIWTKLFG